MDDLMRTKKGDTEKGGRKRGTLGKRGTLYLIPVPLPFPARRLPLERSVERLLKLFHKGVFSQRSAGAFVFSYDFHFFLGHSSIEEQTPITRQFKQRRYTD